MSFSSSQFDMWREKCIQLPDKLFLSLGCLTKVWQNVNNYHSANRIFLDSTFQLLSEADVMHIYNWKESHSQVTCLLFFFLFLHHSNAMLPHSSNESQQAVSMFQWLKNKFYITFRCVALWIWAVCATMPFKRLTRTRGSLHLYNDFACDLLINTLHH